MYLNFNLNNKLEKQSLFLFFHLAFLQQTYYLPRLLCCLGQLLQMLCLVFEPDKQIPEEAGQFFTHLIFRGRSRFRLKRPYVSVVGGFLIRERVGGPPQCCSSQWSVDLLGRTTSGWGGGCPGYFQTTPKAFSVRRVGQGLAIRT